MVWLVSACRHASRRCASHSTRDSQSHEYASRQEKLLAQGAIPGGNTPEDFAKFIDVEHKKWAQVVKVSGAKVD